MSFSYKSPPLSRSEANRIREEETQNLLSNKKLILVLDLNNTLLHTCPISKLTPDEKYLLADDETIIKTNFSRLVRFLVHEFLQQVSTMFELYVYTLSNRDYAKHIVQLLDPDNKNNYFGSRVIRREDITMDPARKSLDLVLGQERTILILDDRKDVWSMNNIANLIQVHPYRYFSSSYSQFNYCTNDTTKSLAEMKIDENENIMRSYLDLLKRIHTRFFDEDPKIDLVKVCDRDVMKKVRVEILGGCKVLLRHFSPMQKEDLQEVVKELGGICAGKLDSSVTHLVAVRKKA